MTTAETVVHIDSVTRSFVGGHGQTIEALGRISLEPYEGEFVCIVGPSGCGKSTLLRIVAGLIRPSDGKVSIRWTADQGGPRLRWSSRNTASSRGKPCGQNVRYGLDLGGVGRSEANRIADEWIDRLALTGFGDAYPATLSGGMKQRVSIARALADSPRSRRSCAPCSRTSFSSCGTRIRDQPCSSPTASTRRSCSATG